MPFEKTIVWFRKKRSLYFEQASKFFLNLKISANIMTGFALLCGLLSVYFLFNNYLLFIIFGLLHIIADSLDGVIARATKPTKFGKYFDFFSDRAITYLILIRLYFFLDDYYLLIVIGLVFINHLIHLLTNFTYPATFYRSGAILVLAFYPLFPEIYLTLGYLIIGIFAIYSLLLQLKKLISTSLS